MSSFARIVDCFEQAGRPVQVLDSGGCLAVIPEGARLVALAPAPGEPSVLFSHPELERMAAEGLDPLALRGGPGGLRLRFAPAYAYAGQGAGRDLAGLAGCRLQPEEDPGRWRLRRSDEGLVLSADPVLTDCRDGSRIEFEVELSVSLTASPLAATPSGVRFAGCRRRAGVRISRVEAGRCVALRHQVQVHPGGTLLLPLRRAVPPTPYCNEGGWRLEGRFLSWRFGGTAEARIGCGRRAVTDRAAVLSAQGRDWTLVVLHFPVRADRFYCDAVCEERAGDQVFQAWDGHGFGEMEYHGPAVGAPPLPDHWEEESRLWAFRGPPEAIRRIARELLGGLPASVAAAPRKAPGSFAEGTAGVD